MLNLITNQIISDNITIFAVVVTAVGLSIGMYNNYANYMNNVRPRPIDTTRMQEGLPTEVTLTPEDFERNPELAQIFEGVDVNNNLDLTLESNEHFVENHYAAIDSNTLMEIYDVVETFISAL